MTILDFKKGVNYSFSDLIEGMMNTKNSVLAELVGNGDNAKRWGYVKDNYRAGQMSLDKRLHLLNELGFYESKPQMLKK